MTNVINITSKETMIAHTLFIPFFSKSITKGLNTVAKIVA